MQPACYPHLDSPHVAARRYRGDQSGRELGAGPDSPTADLEGDALMSGVDRERNREN